MTTSGRASLLAGIGFSISMALLALLALAALSVAAVFRTPLLAADRAVALPGMLALATAILAALLVVRRFGLLQGWLRLASAGCIGLLALASIATALAVEARFHATRHHVLTSERAMLARVGRHVIVGYRDIGELHTLIKAGAIGGVSITRRNVAEKSFEQVRSEIALLQTLRRETGQPPLWIATDQEGGRVSRLSPPLPRPETIRSFLAGEFDQAVEQRVGDFAVDQGRQLAALGVNLNFAPVVDLDFGIDLASDKYSRITERAIARDPMVVSRAAGAYCDGLARAGVMCTLKHFPGLGRVSGDTHVGSARLAAPLVDLEAEDWAPFRAIKPGTAVMVGHVSVDALGSIEPATLSYSAVTGMLRQRIGHAGIIVTDDLGMGAIYRHSTGIGPGAVRAMQAGCDLLLVSFDVDQVYAVLASLIEAEAAGRLAPVLEESAARIARHGPR